MSSTTPSRPATDAARRAANRAYLLCSLAITVLSCIINWPGINNTEVIDDHDLLHNPVARGCGRNPIDCFRNSQFRLYYRPLLGASLSVGENLHGQGPLAFHVENFVLHGFVVLEACWAFRLLLRRERSSLLAGLLYGVHPLQVPVTTFIGGRTDTIALLFLFWFVIGAVKSGDPKHTALWRAVSLIGFTGAIFCKEQCAPLALLAPLLATLAPHGAPRERKPAVIRPWMLAYAVPIVVLVVAAIRVIPPHAIDTVGWKATATQVEWDLGLRIEMVGRTLAFFAKCFVWPTPNSLHQSTLGPWDTPQPITALAGFFAAGIWLAITLHTWPEKGMRALSLWVILMVAPCLNIIPIPSQFVACYRAAIPHFGVAGLGGALFDLLISSAPEGARTVVDCAAPALLGTSLAILSLCDVPLWRSDIVLTQAQIAADPNFLPAFAGLATAQRHEGLVRKSIATNSLVIDRVFPRQHTLQERATVIDTPWMLRNVKSQSSLRYQPRGFVDYVARERGGAEQDTGLYLQAIDDYRLALMVQPDDNEVIDALVYCMQVSGQYDDVTGVLERLVARAPSAVRLERLGANYIHLGRWIDAKRTLTRALIFALREHSPRTKEILKLYDSTEGPARRAR